LPKRVCHLPLTAFCRVRVGKALLAHCFAVVNLALTSWFNQIRLALEDAV